MRCLQLRMAASALTSSMFPAEEGRAWGWPKGPFQAPVFPLVTSSFGHARQLQLTPHRDLMMHALVRDCLRPSCPVCFSSQLLKRFLNRKEAGSFSLKIILNSSDNTKSKDDYINNNIISELLLHTSCYLSALYIYMHRSFNSYNTSLVIFIFPDEEIELIRG